MSVENWVHPENGALLWGLWCDDCGADYGSYGDPQQTIFEAQREGWVYMAQSDHSVLWYCPQCIKAAKL